MERFELLVDELSAVMTRTPAHQVDREIDIWLGKISQALDLDRSGIYERDSPYAPVRTTHIWKRPKIPPFPRDYSPGKILKATADRASAIIPMWAGNRVVGAASFGKLRAGRQWSPRLLEQLTLAVRLFGSAIERKQAQIERQALRAQLRIASRRNMMSELVASLAHEINQPLGAIMSNLGGVARLLSRNGAGPATALAAVNNAIEDTRRAADIIRRVRSMFKAEVEHKAAVSIGTLAGEVINLVAGEANLRKIQVLLDVSPVVKRVIGDRIQLQQCILNLLMNAMDSVAEKSPDRREVAIRIAAEKPGWSIVSVRDNGVGIAPSVADRLFEPFVTTKSSGMGLGLLVTRSIVENHGGRISASNNPDGGATFAFTLPLARRKPAGSSRDLG
jgi:signal transduction histidine kinase